MKNLSTAYKNALQNSTTSISYAIQLIRKDGLKVGFTNFDKKVAFDNYPTLFYKPSTGFATSSIETNSSLNVSDLQFEAFLNTPDFQNKDLEAGLWDYATILFFKFNNQLKPYLWADIEPIMKGSIGEVKKGQTTFVAEARSLTQPLQNNINKYYQLTCRAKLGDSKCGVNLESYKQSGIISLINDNNNFYIDITEEDYYFRNGIIKITSGDNANFSKEIKINLANQIFLQDPFPYALNIGDTFDIYPGCNKVIDEDCLNKFNNVINFRGEPYMTGRDFLVKGIS